ncbi:ArsR/SmtB family transcription factor [Demequina pelophila]|uniref:ArsR/SmtB family transcription factor n=1 Tax=Demequina pelophila TaxID=1638984 RepID=UPI00157B997D|nr:metalloregulator ArsR/SmtB family transcription factor [Demequina pelophila]
MFNHVVVDTDLSDDQVDRIFRALADSTRRDIVARTLVEASSVSDLAREYAMSFAAVSKHVAVLEDAGLVIKEVKGRQRIVHGDPDRIRRAHGLLERYEQLWRSRIDRLDAVLAQPDA